MAKMTQLPSSHSNRNKGKGRAQCPSPPRQKSVSDESVDAWWLDQVLISEEEELEAALAASLSSGTAYYPMAQESSSSQHISCLQTFPTADASDNNSLMTDTPQAYPLPEDSSVNPTMLSTSPTSNPDDIGRIIKPLPKRSLRSRFLEIAARVTKPLPKRRTPKACSLNDPNQPSAVEGSATPSSSTYIPPSPPSDPMAGTSTPMDVNDRELLPKNSSSASSTSSPAASNTPSSSTLSTSLPLVSVNTKSQSPANPQQMSANESDDEDIDALIKRFARSHIIWVDDKPDPLSIPQPAAPLQTSQHRANNGVATPIDRSAGNMVVETNSPLINTSVESIYELNYSEEVSQSDTVPGTSQVPDLNDAALSSWSNLLQNTNDSNYINKSYDDPKNVSVPQNETNYAHLSDPANTITSTFHTNISSNELSVFSSTFLSGMNQPDSDASMGFGDHQPSWQQGQPQTSFDTIIPQRYDSDPTYYLADTPALTSDNQQFPTHYSQVSAYSGANNYAIGQPSGLSKDLIEAIRAMGELGGIDDSDASLNADYAFSNKTGQHQHTFHADHSGMEDTAAAPISSLPLSGDHENAINPTTIESMSSIQQDNIAMDDSDNGLHHESPPPVASLSLELSDKIPESSVVHNNSIPTCQLTTTNGAPMLQTPVHPDDLGQSSTNFGIDSTNTSSQPLQAAVEDNFDIESLYELLSGDVERDAVVTTGFTEEILASTFNIGLASDTENDTTSPNEQWQSTSISDFELSPAIPGHSSPSNDCASRTPLPSIHPPLPSSGQFLSPLARPRSPALPSILQPAVQNNNDDVPPQADVVLTCPAPDVRVSPTVVQAFDTVTSTAVTVPQPSAIHVPSTLDQDNSTSMPPDPVPLDQNMDFVPLAPVAELDPQSLYEASDIDMCQDTSPGPSYLPSYDPNPFDNSSNAPEMSWRDTPQGPNGDDPMDLDEPMTSGSDLYRQSHQIEPEMASADGWRHAEVFSEDVEMNEISAEPDIVHEVHLERCPPTPMTNSVILDDPVPFPWDEEEPSSLPNIAATSWSVDPSRPDFATALDAPVEDPVITQAQSLAAETPSYQTCPEAHKPGPQRQEMAEPTISLQPRTTAIPIAPTPMVIPPLQPQLLMGDMLAFMQQISTVVNTLDSLASLSLEAQAVATIQTTATQPVSATNRQPMAHGRGLQSPESEAPAHEPSTAEPSSDMLDRVVFNSMDRNPEQRETAQPEDTDINVHLPDYGAQLNNFSTSNPTRGRMANNTPSTTLPLNGGEMQTTDESAIQRSIPDPPSERDSRRRAKVSKTKSKDLSKFATGINPSRARRRVRFAVDIANTRYTFGTETSEPQFQPSVPSTALRVEVSSHTESIPESSTPAALQLGKTVEIQGFWGNLWGALSSFFWEDSPSDTSYSR